MINPIFSLLFTTLLSQSATREKCHLPAELRDEIGGYKPVVHRILSSFNDGAESGTTYNELAVFADRFGHRMVGSESLESSIDYLIKSLRQLDLDSVVAEPVAVPVWSRGLERASLVSPRHIDMDILGLGGSVSTPAGGITAPVIVVSSFDELEQRRDEVNGTIVLFRPVWHDYWSYVEYRSAGPSRAAKLGAFATLVRSATSFSLYTPHTGMVSYEKDVPRIPAAAVTVEDADLMARIVQRGEQVVVRLEMENNHTRGTSRNIVADITGTTEPNQYVIVGSHTDSWDVGQGVLDDAGGVFVSLMAAGYLRKLNLRPRRTIRVVMWTSEENGLFGGAQFVHRHSDEMDNVSLVLESDMGTFEPSGLTTSTENNVTWCILEEVLSLMEPIGATRLEYSLRGSEATLMQKVGVPMSTLLNKNDHYFHYHHTKADTMSIMNSRDLDLSTAFWAAVSYVLADLRDMLPR